MTHQDEKPLPPLIVRGQTRSVGRKAVLLSAASVFFVLGVVGWLVPVVTGIPFYVLALVCLGMASDRVARRINAWERRLPRRHRLVLRRFRWRARRNSSGAV